MEVSSTTGMPFKYFHLRWKSYTFMEKVVSEPVKFRTKFMGSIEWNLQLRCHVISKEDLADFEFVLRVTKYDNVSDSNPLKCLRIFGFLKFSEKPGEVVSDELNVYHFKGIYCSSIRHPTSACVKNGGFCLDIIMYPDFCPMELARTFAERSTNDIVDNPEFYAEEDDETLLLHQLKTLVEANTYDFIVKCVDQTEFTHKFIIYNRLGNFTGEKIDENVESERKECESFTFRYATADILDALLRYVYEAVIEPIKRLLTNPETRRGMLLCLTEYNMWKVYLHLTPDYTRYEVYTLGDQGRQNFSINFPLIRNDNEEFSNVFKYNLKLQPPTFAEGAVITLNFFGTKTLHLCVYVRLLHPATGVGSLIIQHKSTRLRRETKFNMVDHQFSYTDFGEVLSKYDVENHFTVTFDVDFYFCVVTNQEIVKHSVESPHAYTPLESLRRDMRNAYIRKINPDCLTISNADPFQEVKKIAAHQVILKHRLKIPDALVKSGEVQLPLSKESLRLLLEYAYCGTIYIPFASQNVLDEFKALFNSSENNSLMLKRLIESLQNLLLKPSQISTISMIQHFDKLKLYNLVKDAF